MAPVRIIEHMPDAIAIISPAVGCFICDNTNTYRDPGFKPNITLAEMNGILMMD